MLPAYGAWPYTATEIAGLGGTSKEKKPFASATPDVEYPARESIAVTLSPGTWLPSNESTRYPETLEMIGHSVAFVQTTSVENEKTHVVQLVYPGALARTTQSSGGRGMLKNPDASVGDRSQYPLPKIGSTGQ